MSDARIFRCFKTSPEIIGLAVMIYGRYPISLRNVEDLLHERVIDITHQTVRFWWNWLRTIFDAAIRCSRVQAMRSFRHLRWHVDEMFLKINGVKHSRRCISPKNAAPEGMLDPAHQSRV